MESKERDWLTVAEAAALLAKPSLSISTVQKLCRRGELAGAYRIGRDWHIPREAITATLSARYAAKDRGRGRPRKTP